MTKKFLFVPAFLVGVCAMAQTPAQTPAKPPAATAKPPATPAKPPAAPAVIPTRIGIINIQQAVASTHEGKKAIAELQTKFNPRKSALEKRQADIQGLQDQLKKGGATIAEAARERIVRDIDVNSRSLNHDADDLNADVEQEQSKLMQDLGGKMMAIIDQYAAQNGYAVILDVSNQQHPVFWADPSTIITGDLIKLYDQAHPATGAAAKPAAPRPPAPKPAAPATAKPNTPAPPAAKKQ